MKKKKKTNIPIPAEEVMAIKLLLKTGLMTHKQIGDVFGRSREAITKIKLGIRHKDKIVGENNIIKRIVVVQYVNNDSYEVREL